MPTNARIYLILAGCCEGMLAVVIVIVIGRDKALQRAADFLKGADFCWYTL